MDFSKKWWMVAIDREGRTRGEIWSPRRQRRGKEKDRERGGERLDEIALNDLRFSLVSPSCCWERRTSRCCSCRICYSPSSLPPSLLVYSRAKVDLKVEISREILLLLLPPLASSFCSSLYLACSGCFSRRTRDHPRVCRPADGG